MGGAASSNKKVGILYAEAEKPEDLSDVLTPRGESMQKELKRLRALVREQAEASKAAEAVALKEPLNLKAQSPFAQPGVRPFQTFDQNKCASPMGALGLHAPNSFAAATRGDITPHGATAYALAPEAFVPNHSSDDAITEIMLSTQNNAMKIVDKYGPALSQFINGEPEQGDDFKSLFDPELAVLKMRSGVVQMAVEGNAEKQIVSQDEVRSAWQAEYKAQNFKSAGCTLTGVSWTGTILFKTILTNEAGEAYKTEYTAITTNILGQISHVDEFVLCGANATEVLELGKAQNLIEACGNAMTLYLHGDLEEAIKFKSLFSKELVTLRFTGRTLKMAADADVANGVISQRMMPNWSMSQDMTRNGLMRNECFLLGLNVGDEVLHSFRRYNQTGKQYMSGHGILKLDENGLIIGYEQFELISRAPAPSIDAACAE